MYENATDGLKSDRTVPSPLSGAGKRSQHGQNRRRFRTVDRSISERESANPIEKLLKRSA